MLDRFKKNRKYLKIINISGFIDYYLYETSISLFHIDHCHLILFHHILEIIIIDVFGFISFLVIDHWNHFLLGL